MQNTILLLVLCILTLNSCIRRKHVEAPADSNYLIFGHFYGFCAGEACVEIFRLDDNTLSEDVNDTYPGRTNFYTGNYVALSRQKFNDVNGIMNSFPNGLLSETNIVIGKPDEADGGGLYIEYNFNGLRKFWFLDNNRDNVPVAYHAFMDTVVQKITLLQ